MKTKLLLLLALSFFAISNAQIVNIPDANLKARLLLASTTNQIAFNSANTPIKIDVNNDGQIQLSETIPVYRLYLPNVNISNLTGIESFGSLNILDVGSNNITSLTLSNMLSLNVLWIDRNPITNLNLSLTNLTELYCGRMALSNLNVTGLTSLVKLNCNGQSNSAVGILTSIDVSGLTNLEEIDCSYNQITSLNLITNTNLKKLNCSTNQLTSIDLLNQPNLENLNASANQVTNLQLFTPNNSLSYINVRNNFITNFDFNVFPAITELSCGNNPLTNLTINNLSNLVFLDVESLSSTAATSIATIVSSTTNFPLLEEIFCNNNPIGSITLNQSNFPSLKWLYARNCNLTQFTASGSAFERLIISNNLINTLNLSNLPNIQILEIHNNPFNNLTFNYSAPLTFLSIGSTQSTITSLNLSTFPLTTCGINNSTALNNLNIKNGTAGNLSFSNCPNLQYICADDGEINAIQNNITTYGYTNCHVNTYCNFTPGGTFYTIQGNHRWDTNSNGCDTTDFLFPNMKLNISNGTTTTTLVTGNDGSYHYDVPEGTYTMTPVFENPTYFTSISSTTGNIVFPTVTSPYVRDFCVSAVGNNPDLEVAVYPLSIPRAGFNNTFQLVYKNKGGIPQNGSVNFTYNDNIQDFINSTVAPTTQSNGSLSWNFINLLPFETKNITLTFNLNTPTDTPPLNSGDILNYNASINGNFTDVLTIDNSASVNQTVVNSYDPNDKTCVEGTVVSPSMAGKFVHYVIRFENTGTADAINVVIRDIIDTTKFDINSLIPQSGSHTYTTRIINTNQVEFIFENINLPFDDTNNDGFVAFKIKLNPSLVAGDTFSNSANIYFDYNFPVITNNYVTTLQSLGLNENTTNNLITIYPNPVKDIIHFNTQEMVYKVEVYDITGRILSSNTIINNQLNLGELTSGNYILKVYSESGFINTKIIKE